MIMEKFASPEWINLKDKILYERTVTLKEGIEKLFGMLQSSKKKEIISYVKENVKLRNGFEDFISFCEKERIEFNILSGGLDFHIYPVLDKYKDKIKIFCNKANFSGDKIRIDYEFLPKDCNLCGNCGCCKVEIVESYSREKFFRIVIGDGLADLFPSKIADLVFARGDLIEYLKQEKIPFVKFSSFYEVQEQLKQQLLTMKK